LKRASLRSVERHLGRRGSESGRRSGSARCGGYAPARRPTSPERLTSLSGRNRDISNRRKQIFGGSCGEFPRIIGSSRVRPWCRYPGTSPTVTARLVARLLSLKRITRRQARIETATISLTPTKSFVPTSRRLRRRWRGGGGRHCLGHVKTLEPRTPEIKWFVVTGDAVRLTKGVRLGSGLEGRARPPGRMRRKQRDVSSASPRSR
jgi:hypothetical protein